MKRFILWGPALFTLVLGGWIGTVINPKIDRVLDVPGRVDVLEVSTGEIARNQRVIIQGMLRAGILTATPDSGAGIPSGVVGGDGVEGVVEDEGEGEPLTADNAD